MLLLLNRAKNLDAEKHNSYMKKVSDMEKKTVWPKKSSSPKKWWTFSLPIWCLSRTALGLYWLCVKDLALRFSVKKVVRLKVGLCVKGAA